MVHRFLVALALPAAQLLTAPAAAQTTDAALLRCLEVRDTAARLACYDELAHATRNAASHPAAKTSANANVSPSSSAKVDAEAPAAAKSFGLKSPAASVKALDSQIVGTLDGWRRGQQLKLANGQVWQVNDDGTTLPRELQSPGVQITPGTFGSYFMKIEGVSFQIKVKRVQ